MKKTMTSKKGAKEETEKNKKFDQARSKKEVLNLRSFFSFFSALKSPREPPRGWGSAEGDVACSRGKTVIFEKKCARASAAAHFSKMGRETSG